MKRKVGTVLEDDLMREAKRQAAVERRSLSELFQDALRQYLRQQPSTPRERRMAYQVFCEQPIRLSSRQLHQLLDEDMWQL